MKKHLIYLLIIVGLLIVIGLNRCDNTTTTVTTETSTEVDSTVVDSLEEEISYLKSLPPDTVYADDPETEQTGESTDEEGNTVRTYTSTFTDSIITAEWTSTVRGELIDSDFWYVQRATPVTEKIKYRYTTQYITTTKTKTITKHTGGFLAVGGSVGISQIGVPYEAELRYQAKDGYSYHGKYTKLPTGHDAIMVGLTIPIRLKSIF